MYIVIKRLSVLSTCFLRYIQSNLEYLIQGIIHQIIRTVGSDILKLLFLYDFFIFFHGQLMLRFDKVTCLSLLFKFVLPVRLSNSLIKSDVLVFFEFIDIVSFLFYNFIEFIILLDTFLVTFFASYKEYIV